MVAKRTVLRALSGIAVVGAFAGVVAADMLLMPSEAQQSLESRTFETEVVNGSDILVCGPGFVDPENINAGGKPAELVGSTGVDLAGGGAVAPASRQPVVSVADAPDGLFVEECAPPLTSSVVVSGVAAKQEDTVLIIANPGSKPVQVKISGIGQTGLLEGPGSSLTIPAATTQSWLTPSWFPDEEMLGVQIEAGGAGVAAWLQGTGFEGELSNGSSRVRAEAAATELVFPLVDESTSVPTLRLANPGDTDAVATVAVTGKKGLEVLKGAEAVKVPARTSAEITLAGVGKAPTGVVVSSDQPLGASVSNWIKGEEDPALKEPVYSRVFMGPAVSVEEPRLPKEEDISKALENDDFTKPDFASGKVETDSGVYNALRVTVASKTGNRIAVLNIGGLANTKQTETVTISSSSPF